MNDSSLDTVTEAQAPPQTRAIYEDIKSTLGVALVNLVWRHLAIKPSVLRWSWNTLKPHYAQHAIPEAAWSLRCSVKPPLLNPLSPQELAHITREAGNVAVLDAVLHTYERGNAQNLVAMCFLQRCIDETPRPHPAAMEPQTACNVEATDRVDQTAIPALPATDTLSADLQRRISEMTAIWVTPEYRGITPSVFRHIALWPDTLVLYQERVCDLLKQGKGALDKPTHDTIALADALAAVLPHQNNVSEMLTQAEIQWLRQTLDLFIKGMIARGVIIVPAMRAILSPHR